MAESGIEPEPLGVGNDITPEQDHFVFRQRISYLNLEPAFLALRALPIQARHFLCEFYLFHMYN